MTSYRNALHHRLVDVYDVHIIFSKDINLYIYLADLKGAGFFTAS